MTRRTGFPLANSIITALAILLIVFLLTVPRHFLTGVTEKLRTAAWEAEYAVLQNDLTTADEAIARMCADFTQAEQPLKLFLNHEEVDELRTALCAARDLAVIDESGNLLTELQIILRIVDYWDDTETLSIYNLF